MFLLFIIFVASSATEQSYFQRIATTPIYLKKNIEKQLLSGDVYSVYNGIMISSPLPLMNFHLKTDV